MVLRVECWLCSGQQVPGLTEKVHTRGRERSQRLKEVCSDLKGQDPWPSSEAVLNHLRSRSPAPWRATFFPSLIRFSLVCGTQLRLASFHLLCSVRETCLD